MQPLPVACQSTEIFVFPIALFTRPAVFQERNSFTHKGDANALEFHSDQGATDLIALLSIAAAKEGGESLLVSAIAIHNELLRRGRQVGRVAWGGPPTSEVGLCFFALVTFLHRQCLRGPLTDQ